MNAQWMADADDVVRIDGLRVVLPGTGRVIVDDVALSIAAGEVLGLVGESGSGKTTVGAALLGFVRKGAVIEHGQVDVAGQEPMALSPAALQAFRGGTIGYVPQDPATALNPALRIGRQLDEVLAVHEPALSPRERESRIAEVLADVELAVDPRFRRRYPHQLSGGQQQRICLAMAFLLRPPAIVLDEPTTGLDVSTQARVLEVVRRLCRSHRVAALYITHDLAVVAGLAQRVAVMLQGRIVEQGDARAVLRRPQHPYTAALVAAVPDIDDHPPRQELPGLDLDASARAAAENLRLGAALDALRPGQPVVELSGLRCAYGAVEVIKGVDLTLRSGECLALVGESGSGKTTLSRAVVGLEIPRGGTIALAGTALAPVARMRPARARRALQYIFQNPYASLNPRQTVGRILAKTHRHLFGGSRAQAQRSARDALEQVGLAAAVARQYPEQLSGGERQRVAIARALVCGPRVLVCDEVTSALDVSVQAQILELLARLKHEQGLSLLFVTHNLAVVRRIADRVAVLERGVIVEVGPTDRVLDDPQHPYTQSLLADTPSWARAE